MGGGKGGMFEVGWGEGRVEGVCWGVRENGQVETGRWVPCGKVWD